MATPMILKDAYLSINGTDISSYIKSVTLNGGEYDEVEVTAMGDQVHNAVPGLGNWSIEVECKQSFASGELDSIIWPLVGGDAFDVVVKPSSAATSANNPKWTGRGRIFGYPPIDGSVGDGAQTKFTIKPGNNQMLVRSTTD